MMIVELIIPIEALRGALRQDGFYFRKYKGRQLLQRCPNRKGHVKTEAEASNQERFAERYGRKTGKKTMENGKDQKDGTGEAVGGAERTR